MTDATLAAPMPIGKAGFLDRLAGHQINGVRELVCADSPIDAALQITQHIHGLAKFMATAAREPDSGATARGDRPLDEVNNEITAGAFEAIGYLAGLANFFVHEADTNGGELERI